MAGSREYDTGLYDRYISGPLGGLRDWWETPRAPYKIPRKDINLPVAPPPAPVEKPWFDRLADIPTPESLGESFGRAHGKEIKSALKETGGLAAGVIGSLSESAGRAAGAAYDVGSPENSRYRIESTGSEKRYKPPTDVIWEGLKGVKSGYEKPWDGVRGPGDEIAERIPEEAVKDIHPAIRAYFRTAGNLPDLSNIVPGKVAAAPLLGLAKAVGGADLATLPWNIFKKVRGIEGLTHQANYASDIDKMIATGFKNKADNDILGRWLHSSGYTKEEQDAAKKASTNVMGSHPSYYGGPHAPVRPVEDAEILDTIAAMPREDIDPIINSLHPVEDKKLIEAIETAYAKTLPWVTSHEDVKSGKMSVDTYKKIVEANEANPIAKEAFKGLERLLVQQSHNIAGRHGKSFVGPVLNAPGMPSHAQGIFHRDYAGGQAHAVALNPEYTEMAPAGSHMKPNTPWQVLGSHATTPNFPVDKPTGLPSKTKGKKVSPQTDAQAWVEQNVEPPYTPGPNVPLPIVSHEVVYKGQPVTLYEQGTINEKVARGLPLTKDQQKKLTVMQGVQAQQGPIKAAENFSKVAEIYSAPMAKSSFNQLSPEAQQLVKTHYPGLHYKATGIKPEVPIAPIIEAPVSGADYNASQLADMYESPNYGMQDLAKHFQSMDTESKEAFSQTFPMTYEQMLGTKAFQDLNLPSALPESMPGFDSIVDPLYDVQPKEEMQKHLSDIRSIWEEYGADVPGGAAKKDFFSPTDPDMTPYQLHQMAINHLIEQGHYTAADEVKELWKYKQADAGVQLRDPWAGQTGDVEDIDWNKIGKLPPDDLPEPPPPITQSAESNLDYLKNTYENVAQNLVKHSGTEMGSIESHTKDVIKQWKTQVAPEEFIDISKRFGADVEALLNTALPLHDIGKPGAIAQGNKAFQHQHTIPIMTEVLRAEGFSGKEVELATELFNHDMIGELLQGSSKLTPEQVAGKLIQKAEKIGMNPSDFAKLQLAFFQADAASYPFVTQFMKQQPGGKWISGNAKVKPIEDLIAKGSSVSDSFQLKDANPQIPGMHAKEIHTKGGKDYLFKPAESGKGHVPYMETSANKVAALGGLYDAGTTLETVNGKVGSMQPLIGNRSDWPSLRLTDLTKLVPSQLRDIIKSHPVDWLTANHDAHKGQWLVTPNGLVEIDRGQAFKHFGEDELSPGYHPNATFGEDPPIYNQLAKLWKEDKLPQLTKGDIESALWETNAKLIKNQKAVMTEVTDALTKFGKEYEIPQAHKRFNNLVSELQKFWAK